MWLTSIKPATGHADLTLYRRGVADVLAEVAGRRGANDPLAAEAVLARRLGDPEIAAVLSATPAGLLGAAGQLAARIRSYQPAAGSPAGLTALIRSCLLAQIDAMWWGNTPTYATDATVRRAADLVELEPLRLAGRLGFRYRRQAETRLARAARRVWPDPTPRVPGLRLSYARPEVVALLNQISGELTSAAPLDMPVLWVTSLVRSVAHQHHLRSVSQSAMLPSSHCAGYAMDIEVSWSPRFDARRVLQGLLLDRQDRGDIAVIDSEQGWHLCISPAATASLRRAYEAGAAG
ncbi:MAG: DUF5715 family protein [Streptosporangiaceae bacterium]